MEKIIGYRCIADCQLDYTKFEQGEEIIISNHFEDNDWKGTEFYEKYPEEFENIYANEVFTINADYGDGEEEHTFVGDENKEREKYIKLPTGEGWANFGEHCRFQLTEIY